MYGQHVISTPGRTKSVLAVKPGSWAFALYPKRDLASLDSLEMTRTQNVSKDIKS